MSVGSEPAIAVVDIMARKVVREIPSTRSETPTGVAYDATDRLIISVCGDGIAKFIDAKSGTEVASLSVTKDA